MTPALLAAQAELDALLRAVAAARAKLAHVALEAARKDGERGDVYDRAARSIGWSRRTLTRVLAAGKVST